MHRLWISGLDTLLRTNFAMLMVKIPKSGILTLTDAQWMPLKVAIWFKIPQSATHDKVLRNSCSVLSTFVANWRKFKLNDHFKLQLAKQKNVLMSVYFTIIPFSFCRLKWSVQQGKISILYIFPFNPFLKIK